MSGYHRKDAFHQRAKREGYRSRAAYKLAEIADRHALLAPGARIVDLGAWPGGWLQVAAERVGPSGRVVGVDLAAIDPLGIKNVFAIQGDFDEPRVLQAILDALGGPADVLLCDAAPKLTGLRDVDRAREESLLEAVAAALPALLRPGGDLLCKLLDSPEANAIGRRLGHSFREARTLRPEATRKASAERYLLARDYQKKGS
ncbi:MAG TPA: RlmE family RNA methyltransferase [Myxococcota bacterium]|nr:RlmE family RNA methyltransferase [Myxococcota bacterium]